MKRRFTIAGTIVFIISILLLSTCAPFFNSQAGQKATGRLSLTASVQGTAKTILPVLPTIDHYTITLVAVNPTGPAEIIERDPGTETSFTMKAEIPVGAWTIQVNAYTGTDEGTTLIGASEAKQVTISPRGTTPVSVLILPIASGRGSLSVQWNLTLEEGQADGATVALLSYPGMVDSMPSVITPTISLPSSVSLDIPFDALDLVAKPGLASGTYLLRLQLSKSGANLVPYTEIVQIYENLTSSKTIALGASDFNGVPLAPDNLSISYAAGAWTLHWNDPSGFADAYNISINGSLVHSNPAGNQTSYVIPEPAPGTSYQVTSHGIGGDSVPATLDIPANSYLVGYDMNGATGGQTPIDGLPHSGGTSIAVDPGSGLARTGYTFAGWTTNPGISGPSSSYAPGASLTLGSSNVYLWAVWIPDNLNFTNGSTPDTAITITGHGSAPTGSFTLPIGVTAIANFALGDCYGMTDITFPSSLVSIGYSSFSNDFGLTSVTIPASVTHIGVSPFYGCAYLTSISVALDNPAYTSVQGVILDKAETLVVEAPSILDPGFVIPSTVESIGMYAFAYSSGVSTFAIPPSVTSIGEGAFFGAGMASVSIPAGLSSIPAGAFGACPSLTSIVVDPANPAYSSSGGYLLDKAGTTLLQAPGGITTFNPPASVTRIGWAACSRCSGLTAVTIPSTITVLESQAFFDSRYLSSISIPASVVSIGGGTFEACYDLVSVMLQAATPPALPANSNAFASCDAALKIHVPSSDAVTAYRQAPGWEDYSSKIISDPEGGSIQGRVLNLSSTVTSLASGLSNPCFATTDGTYVYISSEADGNIYKMDLSGTMTILNNLWDVQGIVSDGTYLYVTSYGSGTVNKVDATSGAMTTLRSGISGPCGITLDGGYLYLVSGNNSVLKMDKSSGSYTTLATGLSTANGITTDGAYLYVTEAGSGNAVVRVDFNGNKTTLLSGSAWGITSDGTYLYITDGGANTVYRVDAGGATTVVTSSLTGPGAITTDGLSLYVTEGGGAVKRIQ